MILNEMIRERNIFLSYHFKEYGRSVTKVFKEKEVLDIYNGRGSFSRPNCDLFMLNLRVKLHSEVTVQDTRISRALYLHWYNTNDAGTTLYWWSIIVDQSDSLKLTKLLAPDLYYETVLGVDEYD